ncbi:FtsX-like permease family protein [Uniformispora flossi]|uniref:FtsX-like permease family protein n=1 Tax=Uniformispora flossi TaxID=3390723 RepID=UPI003C2BA336
MREFAMLRLVGTTRRQIRAMLRWETATVVALGTAIAYRTLSAYGRGMTAADLRTLHRSPTSEW